MSYGLGAAQRAWDAREPHWFSEPEPGDEPPPADDEWKRMTAAQLRALRDASQRVHLANLARHAPIHTPEVQP